MKNLFDFISLYRDVEYMMFWKINQNCNFDCQYCFYSADERKWVKPADNLQSSSAISEAFNRTGITWNIHIDGGEPFLYPDFVPLVRLLTKKHKIGLNTNLSTKNVFSFADEIDPADITIIYASFHASEHEKRPSGVADYIERFLDLQEKGFNIVLSYVSYPPNLSRVEDDFAMLKSKGIGNLGIKTFTGHYNGREYPNAYSTSELETINKYALMPVEQKIALGDHSFYSHYCRAGSNYFFMNPDGDLFRCHSSKTRFGNLFTDSFKIRTSFNACPINVCSCLYEGEILAESRKGSVLLERIKEAYYRIF